MSDLIDKLNTLLRASLNSFLSGERSGTPPPANIAPDKLGKDVDREIAALRKQIDAALSDEERKKARIAEMQRQMQELDRQADFALEQGQEERARQLVQQIQRLRRQTRDAEAELERFQQATFDLIQHVNTLEAMVVEARQAQAAPIQREPMQQEPQVAPAVGSTVGQKPEAAERTPVAALSDILRGVRERVEEAISPITRSQQPAEPLASREKTPEKEAQDSEVSEIDDDLAKRRARLSKPE